MKSQFTILITTILLLISGVGRSAVAASKSPRLPTLPTAGIQGSVGAGFTDFVVTSPAENFKLDRGTYVAAQLERSFDFAHLYFTMTLSQMNAEGTANYSYTNLSSSTTYTAKDVGFNASLMDLSLGFKLKLIEGYWFRPYIEGGGIGSYHQLNYKTKVTELNAQGTDWKSSDVIMGSGGYGEGGIEVAFSDNFGVKFAARYSEQTTKELVTQKSEKMKFRAETYYFSALFGF